MLARSKRSSFQQIHRPHYESPKIEAIRKQIFKNNLAKIVQHNKEYELGLHTYRKGVNQFSDMTEDEALKFASCFQTPSVEELVKMTEMIPANDFKFSNAAKVPDAIDYRDQGAVTRVKNQGKCGSCWAFATTGVLESHHFLKKKKLLELSEQQLIDCSERNRGCNGGHPYLAMKYVKKNGISTAESYPYMMMQSSCQYKPSMKVPSLKVVTFTYTSPSDGFPPDEHYLKQLVGYFGPMVVAIEVGKDFINYSEGIFFSDDCKKSSSAINHAVLVVGYGTDKKTGQDFWIVKNSWGEEYGEKGYIRMARNRNNNCNIASIIVRPVLQN
ncbi:unnamed protein product [Hermetia illucens]|uniref:cathepsin L n=1 Tax=Hermetia illucens TaxID=343691 RepID=A0A7R8YX49_HERIL|nr:unnamed protein product [Hermetia illucens]